MFILIRSDTCANTYFWSFSLLPIEACEFTIVSVHPMGKEQTARILPHGLQERSALLSTEVVVVTPENISDQFVNL